MAESAIDRVMTERRAKGAASAETEDKFFQIAAADGPDENFLELQLRNGLRTCFNFTELHWYSWDPEASCMDLEFGGFLVTIRGRGLYPGLFQAVGKRRVSWVREADSEMQDHEKNAVFISEIEITPPEDYSGEEEA